MKHTERQYTLIAAHVVATAVFMVSFMASTLPGQVAPSTHGAGGPAAPTLEGAVVPANPITPPAPTQPIPYSHKLHLAMPGVTCQTCHTNPQGGAMMTFPASSVCMKCHTAVATDRPAIQKLASLAKGKDPIPWQRVYIIRPNHVGEQHEPYEKSSGVQWSHKNHIDAKIGCEACHGNVAQMDVMAEVTTTTTKGGCMTCHNSRSTSQFKSKSTACATCHQDYKHIIHTDWRSLDKPSWPDNKQ